MASRVDGEVLPVFLLKVDNNTKTNPKCQHRRKVNNQLKNTVNIIIDHNRFKNIAEYIFY